MKERSRVSSTIASGTLWNLLGQAMPALAALFAIPVLVRQLGTDRFGILTLAWALIGYFGLFDLGLSRALTKVVAERLAPNARRDIARLVWTALYLMTCLGTIGALAFAALSPWLVHHALRVPTDLERETEYAFLILASCIPVVVASAGLRGVLEAQLRFDLTNAVRIPFGVLTFLAPLAVLPFSRSAFAVVSVLALTRVLSAILHLWLCIRLMPEMHHTWKPDVATLGPLLRFGSWMTVSNVVSPLMVTLDRFVIGAAISVSAVAYYSTPYEVVTKLLLIPSALVGVLFPAFSATFAHDRARTGRLFRRGTKLLLLALFPVTLVMVTFAHEGLALWLGGDFADKSTPVLQLLAIGVFLNGLAHVPFALVQGIGRPDLTARLHLAELPLYLAGLWFLTTSQGIRGAAIAWTVRAATDAVVLFAVANRSTYGGETTTKWAVLASSASLLIFGFGLNGLDIRARTLMALFVLAAFAPVGWYKLLSGEDRTLISNGLKILRLI